MPDSPVQCPFGGRYPSCESAHTPTYRANQLSCSRQLWCASGDQRILAKRYWDNICFLLCPRFQSFSPPHQLLGLELTGERGSENDHYYNMYSDFITPTPYQTRAGGGKLQSDGPPTLNINTHNSNATSNAIRLSVPATDEGFQKPSKLTIDRAQLDGPSVMDNTQAPPISPGIGSRALGPCAECGLRIISLADACHALGYLYHNSCFVCCYCREYTIQIVASLTFSRQPHFR